MNDSNQNCDAQPSYAKDSKLGQYSNYHQAYSPDILHPIARSAYRGDIPDVLSYGVDLWTCYELSWLNKRGRPSVRWGQITVPCHSPYILESKSLKLYFNSLNQHRFDSPVEFLNTVEKDLSDKVGAEVSVVLNSVGTIYSKDKRQEQAQAICIDLLDIECNDFTCNASLLITESGSVENERLCSHLMRSNCPITNQPDWATITICYSGRKICPHQLLKYIVSYRMHNGFHEHCVEKFYTDLMQAVKPDALTVVAQFTRRGGIDISPCRSSEPQFNLPPRVNRQ